MSLEVIRIVIVFIGVGNLALAWNCKQEIIRFFLMLLGMLAINTGAHI